MTFVEIALVFWIVFVAVVGIGILGLLVEGYRWGRKFEQGGME